MPIMASIHCTPPDVAGAAIAMRLHEIADAVLALHGITGASHHVELGTDHAAYHVAVDVLGWKATVTRYIGEAPRYFTSARFDDEETGCSVTVHGPDTAKPSGG